MKNKITLSIGCILLIANTAIGLIFSQIETYQMIISDAVILFYLLLNIGINTSHTPVVPITAEDDKASTGLNVAAFIFPFVGLVLYFVKKEKYPIQAKGILKWTLIGIGVWFVFNFLVGLLSY